MYYIYSRGENLKNIVILMKVTGVVPDDVQEEQLEDCLYNNIMFDIKDFEVNEVEFLVKELEDY